MSPLSTASLSIAPTVTVANARKSTLSWIVTHLMNMDTTPPSIPKWSNSDEIVLTDRELVSCYMRYSENLEQVSYSPEKACAGPDFSSPASAISNHDGDTSHLSGVSNSTTQTTPLRNDLLAMARRVAARSPFEEFEATLQSVDLPKEVKDEYRAQGQNILQIGGHLFPRSRRLSRPEGTLQALALIHATGDWFASAAHDAEIQVQNIAYIQTLGPFTTRPEPEDMWAVYKQMAELVIKHTKPPSRAMVDVIEALAAVYDAYVYQPALVSRDMLSTDNDIELQLHGLYDAIMSLLMKAQEWCRSMKALNGNQMKPALGAILSTPITVQGIVQNDGAMIAAVAVLRDPANPGYQPVSAEVLKVLREKRSTQLLQMRAKRKFARVHTV